MSAVGPSRKSESTLLTSIGSRAGVAALEERYGWYGVEVLHVPDIDAVDLLVTRACGHRSRARLDARALSGVDDLFDALDAHNDRGRRCFCVQRPEVP